MDEQRLYERFHLLFTADEEGSGESWTVAETLLLLKYELETTNEWLKKIHEALTQ